MVRTAFIPLILLAGTALAQAQDLSSPKTFSSARSERRAVEAVIWGMPAVNADLMLPGNALEDEGQGKRDRLLVKAGVNWKNQTLRRRTRTSIYFASFWNVKDGLVGHRHSTC